MISAVPGWGKTTMGSYAPSPAIIMSRGETGYLTLLEHGSVPDVPRVEASTWAETLAAADLLASGSVDFETLVLDAAGGFERLCHEEVCRRDFGNDWGEKGFGSFQKGFDVAVSDWLQLLQKLEVLWKQGKGIILLSHSAVRGFKNPAGPDFDRWVSSMHPKTEQVLGQWLDAFLFGTFLTVVQEDKKTRRAKGIGGQSRVLHTQHSDAIVCKNRFGLPPEIDIPDDPAQSWATLAAAMGGSK
jgi:hypothetical protein